MIGRLKRIFAKDERGTRDNGQTVGEHDARVAACALFLEMARIDKSFTEDEMAMILAILQEKYALSRENANDLVEAADRELAESVDLWQFARQINANYSTEEKIEILETLWRIVFVDGKMNQYERYLMLKIGNLLRLDHDQLIQAKLKVTKGD